MGVHGRVTPAGKSDAPWRGRSGERRRLGCGLSLCRVGCGFGGAAWVGAAFRLRAAVGMRSPPQPPTSLASGRWFFTVAFSLEALSKMVAMGLYCESLTTYFRSGWHWLDVVTVRLSRRSTRGALAEVEVVCGGVWWCVWWR